jgi:predicted 2-oxoglutarate/Fe(II)-dependent dioxygenase YbiX
MEAVLKALQKIKRPGTFVTSGAIDPCFLGLEITEVGMVGLPLSENQAQAIIEHCYQAPYGRGEETIVDTDVRRTWQMEPQNIHIHNPQWQLIMRDLVAQIAEQLGLGKSSVSHHLYKMLMYESGDFFTSHRDTEKIDNMFATLLIALPSEHEGGELLVRHGGQEEMIYFGGENKHYQIQYAAFYADCKHEVKPVTHGYRCCLVYNLALENTRRQPMAPDNNSHVEQLSKVLKKHFKQKPSEKMAILLEHQYTKAGLSFDSLKNADSMKAEVLLQAAKQAKCEAYLAMITLWESGNAEDYYDGYSGNEDDAEMGEVYDSSLSVDYWIASDGTEKPFGKINIDEDEIVSETSLEERGAIQQEVHEASGNEGVSMERWYHQTALVIWPKQQHFHQLCQAGQHHTIPQIKEMVQNLATSEQTTDTESWQHCQQFATEIINAWNISDRYTSHQKDYAVSQTMLELLVTISDVELLQQFMKTILAQILSGKEGKTIVKACKQHGWLTFQEELALMAEQDKNALAFVSLFEQLCLSGETTEQLTVCKVLAAKVLTALKAHDNNLNQRPYWYRTEQDDEVNPVESLLKSLHHIDEVEILTKAVAYFSHDETNYPLHTKLIPAVKNLAPWFAARQTHSCVPFQQLSKHCIKELNKRTKARVITPKDWKQNITLSCTCEDCKELQQFLKAPKEQVHRFRVRKDRRQHLHQQIDGHKCDMIHQTDRTGSPHTLVCIKNYSSYEKRQKQWEVDKKLLKDLQTIEM